MTENLARMRWYLRVSGLPSFALMQPGQESTSTSLKLITKNAGLDLNLNDSCVIVLLSANTTGACVAEYDIGMLLFGQPLLRPEGIIDTLGVKAFKGNTLPRPMSFDLD